MDTPVLNYMIICFLLRSIREISVKSLLR